MAARLRKTFHYPSDDNNDDASSTASVLDEQEQETLIETLSTLNANRNATHLRLLSLLPPLASLPFLLRLFFPPPATTSGSVLLLPLLALSSLAATAWLLYTLPTTATGFALLDDKNQSSKSDADHGGLGSGSGSGLGLLGRRGRKTRQVLLADEKSPLAAHLPLLNVAVAVLTFLMGLLEYVKTAGGTVGVHPVLLGALPGIVYAVVVGAKVVMGGVDPEKELSGLKYGYKGA